MTLNYLQLQIDVRSLLSKFNCKSLTEDKIRDYFNRCDINKRTTAYNICSTYVPHLNVTYSFGYTQILTMCYCFTRDKLLKFGYTRTAQVLNDILKSNIYPVLHYIVACDCLLFCKEGSYET